MNVLIRELTTEEEFLDAFTVMKELRVNLSQEEYMKLLQTMLTQGYRMFALLEESKIVAVTGIIELVNLYNEKHIYVYDLVTRGSDRSKGYGEKLLSHIHDLAKETGCKNIALSSGLQRIDAHRFYEERMGYKKTSYSFVYEIK